MPHLVLLSIAASFGARRCGVWAGPVESMYASIMFLSCYFYYFCCCCCFFNYYYYNYNYYYHCCCCCCHQYCYSSTKQNTSSAPQMNCNVTIITLTLAMLTLPLSIPQGSERLLVPDRGKNMDPKRVFAEFGRGNIL